MTIVSQMSNITKAEATSYGAGEYHAPFDTVSAWSGDKSRLDLFLPHGTGRAIADAINAAVKPADEVTE